MTITSAWRFNVTHVNNSSVLSPTVREASASPSITDNLLTLSFRPAFNIVESAVSTRENSVSEAAQVAEYAGLFAALSELRDLDEEDPAAIDSDTFSKAATILSLLASKSARPPKIFSHGGDAAVFSWLGPDDLKYITVSGGCAVFARKARGQKAVTVGVADMSESNAVELLPYVGVIRDGSSTNSIR